MKNVFFRKETIIVLFFAVILLFIFRQAIFGHKILFPSNLLVASYSPWKYQPVPEYPNGPPNKPIGFDDVRQFFPNRKLLQQSLQKGVIPLWNPYIYSGTPFMAAFDTSVWYPLSWVASLLPTVEGWNFLVIIQPILSILFMYLFLKSLKFEKHIVFFGTLVWMFTGFMVVYWQEILVLEHSFFWLPLALYGSNRLWLDHDDRGGLLLLIASLVCSIFGGFMQMSIYIYMLVIAWNIYTFASAENRKRARRTVNKIAAAIGVSVLIACIQLIPTLEAFIMSPRGAANGAITFRDALLPFQNLITFVVPDFWGNPATYNYFGGPGFYFEKMIFIGVIPLILAVYAMIEWKRKDILFWTITAIITLSQGFALPTSWISYILHVPVLANSYPTRIFGLSAFALTVLSCYGLSIFLKEARYRRILSITSVLTLTLIAGWIVAIGSWLLIHIYSGRAFIGKTSVVGDLIRRIPDVSKNASWYATVSLHNLIIPTIFIGMGWGLIILRKRSWKAAFILAAIATLASGLYFANKYIYFSDPRFVYPDLAVTKEITALTGYNRIWGYGNAFLEKNISQYFEWFSTDGYGNLSPTRYAELLSTIANGGRLGGTIRRSDTDIYEASEWETMSSNPYRLRLMSLLGVRYVLEAKAGDFKDKRTREERFPASLFTLVWQDDTWRIWQYTQALPRTIFATKYVVKTYAQDSIDSLYDARTNLGNTVILDQAPGVNLSSTAFPHAGAVIIKYDLNSVTIRTKSDSDGFVLLTDNYYPGWTVTMDGRSEPVYRADYSFKAAFVPKGTHTVVFQYVPQSVIIGGIITVSGFLSWIALTVFVQKK